MELDNPISLPGVGQYVRSVLKQLQLMQHVLHDKQKGRPASTARDCGCVQDLNSSLLLQRGTVPKMQPNGIIQYDFRAVVVGNSPFLGCSVILGKF
jgi:hypothetical protein